MKIKRVCKRLSVLVCLLYSIVAYSQFTNKNFIRIKYDCMGNYVEDVKLFKDSLLMWNFYVVENDTVQNSNLYFYNKNKELGDYVYKNFKLLEIDSISRDKDGNLYQRVIIGEYDHCQGSVECTHDKYGRLVEIKKYSYPKGNNKPKKRVLTNWDKYYYVSNVDYKLLFDGLNSKK